ncbi:MULTISPECIES: DUF3973 domain-containing protein [Paenibacillus]|uniref:DUF3973 domain-containing protein n=1 Tax=Paenibacillus TaxID=44249 RepID=UPI0035C8385A
MDALYFCLHCEKLHRLHYEKQELIFKSGFRYIHSNLYPVGICKPHHSCCGKPHPCTA